MAKEISIVIDKAEISGFSVEFENEYPRVSVEISLYAGEQKITSFRSYNKECTYYGSNLKFDLSPGIVKTILKISKELETAVMQEQNKNLLRLEA